MIKVSNGILKVMIWLKMENDKNHAKSVIWAFWLC